MAKRNLGPNETISLEENKIGLLTSGPVTGNNVIIVDAEDYLTISGYRWHSIRGGDTLYASAHTWINGKRTIVQMHRLLLSAALSDLVDHKDRNGLNNSRRSKNIRMCSSIENMRNRRAFRDCASNYKGVSWYKNSAKWVARIYVAGKAISLGYFVDESEAARAYDNAVRDHYGEFARANFQAAA